MPLGNDVHANTTGKVARTFQLLCTNQHCGADSIMRDEMGNLSAKRMQSGGKDNTKVVVTSRRIKQKLVTSHVGEGCRVDRPPYIWTRRLGLNLRKQHA